jgi:putative DNA-invertase from lambdoid prophage Rac
MNSAIYTRVSTDRQTAQNQLPDLQRLAAARGLDAPEVVTETESGAKRRPELEALVARAKRGEVNVILVTALDRLGRNMRETINLILDLDRLGVRVISHREPWLDMGGPVRPLLLAIFSWVAEQERTVLIERTRAGLARAKRDGKTLGRPRANQMHVMSAVAMVQNGATVAAAVAKWDVTESTLRRYLNVR